MVAFLGIHSKVPLQTLIAKECLHFDLLIQGACVALLSYSMLFLDMLSHALNIDGDKVAVIVIATLNPVKRVA